MIARRCLIAAALLAMPGCGPAGSGAAGQPAEAPTSSPGCAALGGLAGAVDDHGTARSTGSVLSLEADDTYFEPTCATGVPRGTLMVTITNHGKALHNLSVAGQGIDTDLPPGAGVTVRVAVSSAPVPFFCKYHSAAGMQGAIVPG